MAVSVGSFAERFPSAASFAARPHGERLRYRSGCRCLACRAGNSRYETGRLAARKRGEWNGIVSAAPARVHLAELSKAGVGRRAVSEAADVGRTTIALIKAGRKVQIRASTSARILAIDVGAAAGGAVVSARPAWRRIRKLLDEGFTRGRIARELGSTAKAPALQLGKRRITAANAVRVERLYRKYMEEPA